MSKLKPNSCNPFWQGRTRVPLEQTKHHRQRFETNDRLRIPGRGKMIAAVLNAAGEDYGTTDVGASAPHK